MTLVAAGFTPGQAETAFERALRIEDENPWSVTPQVSVGLGHLARSAAADGSPEEAIEIYTWAIDASERALGPDNSNTGFLRSQYIQYLRSLGRDEEAERLSEG